MPIANGEILKDALHNHYAVPAFSAHSFDMVDAILEESQSENYPVIIQIGQRAIRNQQMQSLSDYIRYRAQSLTVPVVIHLDHSHDFSQVVQALRAGFTSCMIDASLLPFGENVALTRDVVHVCHSVSVPVEGELGTIGGVEDDAYVAEEDVVYTPVDAAAHFVAQTGVDSLAVAIGSAHGMYRREPKLDLERLKQIQEAVRIPIVLHGGSGIPREQVRKAISLGIAKINFDTELRIAFMNGWREAVRENADDPFSASLAAQSSLRETVKEKIAWCGGHSDHAFS